MVCFVSNKNENATKISIADTEMKRKNNTDRIYSSDGKLMRTFKNDKGAQVTFTYQIKTSATGSILEATQVN